MTDSVPVEFPNSMGPELIVIAHSDAELRLHEGRALAAAAEIAPFNRALEETAVAPRSLFGPSEARVRLRQRESPWDEPDLSIYYQVPLDPGADHEAIAARLANEQMVAGAYVKPPPAIDAPSAAPAGRPADSADPFLATTADLSGRQNYLDAPPVGVNARSAWTRPGGDGAGIEVMMVGGAWNLQHEDLHGDAAGVIAGIPINALSFRNHGTAMLGIVRADRNDFGVTGIAPACRVRQVATFGLGTAAAINTAAQALPAGGIVLIEWQRPGPGATGIGSSGFIALEWWPDDFAAISAATARGIIVVAPAGNGSANLDAATYTQPLPGFPPTWRNPFDRTVADSGSILVGAGSPPNPTHSRPQDVDCSRLKLSNYGSAVDVQGWGAEVTTLGYGDLQGGGDENLWYTDQFGGSSAASAMVAGVVAALQGVNIGSGSKRAPLTSVGARHLLRSSGSPQQDGTNPSSQRVGPRPELLALIALLPPPKDEGKDGKDSKDEGKENKDNKDTKDNKDNKDNKESKDSKDTKDNKDNKDNKDRKDHKEDKGDKTETPKELKDHAKDKEQGRVENVTNPMTTQASVTEWPIRNLDPVRHFIPHGQRPSLVTAALREEPDLADRFS